jgi:hypothetical protein
MCERRSWPEKLGHLLLSRVVTPHDERSQQRLKRLYFSWLLQNWRRHGPWDGLMGAVMAFFLAIIYCSSP